MTDGVRHDGHEPSTAELVRQTTEQVSRLVRDELALARAEMAEKGKRSGLGAGLFGGSAFLSLYGLAVLVAAAVLGLAVVLPGWLSALIVAVVLFLIAGTLALIGRSEVKQAGTPVPDEVIRSIKADIDAVKEKARR